MIELWDTPVDVSIFSLLYRGLFQRCFVVNKTLSLSYRDNLLDLLYLFLALSYWLEPWILEASRFDFRFEVLKVGMRVVCESVFMCSSHKEAFAEISRQLIAEV
jgi:uncharacterized membrane protein